MQLGNNWNCIFSSIAPNKKATDYPDCPLNVALKYDCFDYIVYYCVSILIIYSKITITIIEQIALTTPPNMYVALIEGSNNAIRNNPTKQVATQKPKQIQNRIKKYLII